MLQQGGEERLREFAARSHQKERRQITDRIHLFMGYGHSNVIAVEGETSILLIDALESPLRAEAVKHEMAHITGKTVETLIYTHGHPDHRGGSGAFRDTVRRIIASSPRAASYGMTERLAPVLQLRTKRQFGYTLTEEELITQGLGIREGHAAGEGAYDILPPTEWMNEERMAYTIDGISFELLSAPGETDDQMYVWFPEERVLCCGDNYYQCWPNLSAIRGGQYRDVSAWTHSLELILTLQAQVLLPGHMMPLTGQKEIEDVISHYKGAIESVLVQTLDCMSRGLSEAETVRTVVLPEEYGDLPYMGEYYGTVAWSVRAVYHGYMGWFDGNPTNLNRLPDRERSGRLMGLMGGAESVLNAIDEALEQNEAQWAVELCDILLFAGMAVKEAGARKAKGLIMLAALETSANGRHYYLACAHELSD